MATRVFLLLSVAELKATQNTTQVITFVTIESGDYTDLL